MQYNDEINWHEQWANHAPGFKDGYLHIQFRELGINSVEKIILAPGPGFGDLSHATTRLVLTMMPTYVADKTVLDVGCGSGILSLAAAQFKAKSVLGIDIDPAAVAHAQANCALNNLTEKCHFSAVAKKPAQILLMNMIRSEQKQAYASLPEACRHFEIAITSGILKEDRDKYLEQTKEWGWKLLHEKKKAGWLGFCFSL